MYEANDEVYFDGAYKKWRHFKKLKTEKKHWKTLDIQKSAVFNKSTKWKKEDFRTSYIVDCTDKGIGEGLRSDYWTNETAMGQQVAQVPDCWKIMKISLNIRNTEQCFMRILSNITTPVHWVLCIETFVGYSNRYSLGFLWSGGLYWMRTNQNLIFLTLLLWERIIGKVVPAFINYEPSHDDVWGSGGIVPSLLTSELDRGEWPASGRCPADLLPGNFLRYLLNKRQDTSQSHLETVGKRKSLVSTGN
jgi:hypothetical protein